jgi:hypothetical protein
MWRRLRSVSARCAPACASQNLPWIEAISGLPFKEGEWQKRIAEPDSEIWGILGQNIDSAFNTCKKRLQNRGHFCSLGRWVGWAKIADM